MIFTCPHCQKQHRLPAEVALPLHAATHCKKCGQRFFLVGNEDDDAHASTDQQRENPTLSVILTDFPELERLPPGKFSLAEIFTPDTGDGHQTRINRLLAKLINATAPLLCEKILQHDEQVYRLARGIAYFPFEIPYANGLLTGPLNYYALIATNHRLLFVNIDYTLSHPELYIFHIPYGTISRVSRGFYGTSLLVATHAGRKWDFTTIDRTLARGMENFVLAHLDQAADTLPVSIAAQLCPSCHQPVPEKPLFCPHCQIAYKSPLVAMKKSLLLPGSGNFYLANRYLGTVEVIGYLFTWMMTIILVIVGIPGGILGGAVLIIAYHLLAAYMAGRMAGKGCLLADGQPVEREIEPVL